MKLSRKRLGDTFTEAGLNFVLEENHLTHIHNIAYKEMVRLKFWNKTMEAYRYKQSSSLRSISHVYMEVPPAVDYRTTGGITDPVDQVRAYCFER